MELRPLTATVPVPAGKVSVPFVAVLGSCRVTLPPPEELSFRLMAYSYKMLMEPASKVSVPLTVVMRTRSSVSERVFAPPEQVVLLPFILTTPLIDQIFEPIKQSETLPDELFAAPISDDTRNPALKA